MRNVYTLNIQSIAGADRMFLCQRKKCERKKILKIASWLFGLIVLTGINSLSCVRIWKAVPQEKFVNL